MLSHRSRWRGLVLRLLWLLYASSFSLCRGAHELVSSELPVLRVGEEVKRESLPFFAGSSREYEVQGLQERKWYEIKISYPASIPASFDISLIHERSFNRPRIGRRLLNTEKMMFYVTKEFSKQATDGLSGRVMVVVHPAGVTAKQHTSDHSVIIYNIFCEEVILGIPKQAWWVGFLAALVFCFAYYISARLPAGLVPAYSRIKGSKEAQ